MEKHDSNLRFTVIGFGKFMEAIFHCIVETVGRDNLANQVNAIVGQKSDISRKKRLFGIEVTRMNNLKALKKLKPDIIFFAPPPNIATTIIHNDLSAYYKIIRHQSLPLSEIYTFAPYPNLDIYLQILGKDTHVAMVNTNPFTQIGGKPVRGESFFTFAMPLQWPNENKERLQRIFQSKGDGIELKPDQIVSTIAAICTGRTLWTAVMVISDYLRILGFDVKHNVLAGYMRAKLQSTYDYKPIKSDPCSLMEGPEYIKPFLDVFISAWRSGLGDYLSSVGVPEFEAFKILTRGLDFDLHIIQMESRKTLRNHIALIAPKGGLTQLAHKLFYQDTKVIIEDAISKWIDHSVIINTDNIRRKVKETANIVYRYSLKYEKHSED